jgi:hypothetical protein
METTSELAQFVALHAELDQQHIILTGKLGIDQVAELLAEPGTDGLVHFFISQHVVTSVESPPLYRELTSDEQQVLLGALKKEEHHLPDTLDPGVFRMFVHQLAYTVEHRPSQRFNGARFGAVVRTDSEEIIGHFALGIDVVGTLHDMHKSIAVETHVVPLHPNRFRRLNEADRQSLATALDAAIKGSELDPLWQQVLQDLTSAATDR